MGRRRRKKTVSPRVQRRLPNVFTCPNCGKDAIRIQYSRDRTEASVQCGSCHIHSTVKVNPVMESIDIYGDFVDQHSNGEASSLDTEDIDEDSARKD